MAFSTFNHVISSSKAGFGSFYGCNSSFSNRMSFVAGCRSQSVSSSERERTKTVTAFYNQPGIDTSARKKSIRLTPYIIMYSGKKEAGSNILRSAQYLQRELPIRIARRVLDFRNLPFIIGCNPIILSVHELYLRAFNILNSFQTITNHAEESRYTTTIKKLLDDHSHVVSDLATGFRECQKHITDEVAIAKFLDTTITSRLSIRMLATHHLYLREERENYVGLINLKMPLREVIERSCQFVSRLSLHKYGRVPEIKLSGHVSAVFPFIEMPLDYILPELLKNAVRATIENHTLDDALPPIYITIASNENDFIIRMSDRGGGIPHHLMSKVCQYNFTTAHEGTALGNTEVVEQNPDQFTPVFSDMMESCNPNPAGGPMHGFGFGLPTSIAYARHMGGDLTHQAMQGIGTDVYLRMKHISSKADSFRI